MLKLNMEIEVYLTDDVVDSDKDAAPMSAEAIRDVVFHKTSAALASDTIASIQAATGRTVELLVINNPTIERNVQDVETHLHNHH